jgi:hypothetical protein
MKRSAWKLSTLALAFPLFVLAISTMVTIVRDVFPLLHPEDQLHLARDGLPSLACYKHE